MEYRDTKTGAVIETDSVLVGDWEPVKKTKKKATKASKDAE